MLYQPLELTRELMARGRNSITVSDRRVVQNYSSAGLQVGALFNWDGALMNTCYSTAGIGTRLRSMAYAALLVMTTGFVAAQSGDEIKLNPSHPETYTVQKEDTLWDISATFLQDPWFWPEIWYVNPQVKNPHLIYPGDILNLVYVDGKPRVQATRGAQNGQTSQNGQETTVRGDDGRLSPTVREEELDQAITSIAFKDIQPFLAGGAILEKDEIKKLPHIVALRDHMIAGAGHEVYVSGLPEEAELGSEYLVLRVDDKLNDPETNNLLGYEMVIVGQGELRAKGDTDTIFLTRTNREARRGDRIKSADFSLPMNFFPSAPTQEVNGQIVAVVDGVSRIGQYNMVIINRGTKHGLDQGNVVSVFQQGRVVKDMGGTGSVSSSGYGVGGKKVQLPENVAGHLMVVKAYDDISYALVMEALTEMGVNDHFRNP